MDSLMDSRSCRGRGVGIYTIGITRLHDATQGSFHMKRIITAFALTTLIAAGGCEMQMVEMGMVKGTNMASASLMTGSAANPPSPPLLTSSQQGSQPIVGSTASSPKPT